MVLTAAERKKKYLDKLKATGGYEAFKKKKAADERDRQQRLKNGLAQLPKAVREKTKRLTRENNRKKAAECRRRKRQKLGLADSNEVNSQSNNSTNTTTNHDNKNPYNTTSAASKAVSKAKRALPAMSEKKKFVVKKMLRSLNPEDMQEIVDDVTNNQNRSRGSKGLKDNVIAMVKAFYERDDISRMSPNMRDCRKFTDPLTGVKEMKQIRYLMYKLGDVHRLFMQHIERGNEERVQSVGLSKFCALRPSHVKLVSSTPLDQDQCLCLYHSNFIMCCKTIHQYLPEFPVYGAELESLLMCKNPNRDCWFRVCPKCVDVKKKLSEILKRSGKSAKTHVSLCQWKKNNETNRFQKCLEKGTLNTLISHFHNILPEFLKHSYIKRSQAAQFQKDNEEALKSDGKLAVVQVDFAEGFNCESQDEIQSAHWNQPTISLFTSCMKIVKEIFPMVIASNDTAHTKNEIACYMFKIIKKIPSTVKTIKIWSDGPNSQFKNRFTAALIKVFQTYHNRKIFWNFFATAHGRGSVDGIGAVVKTRVKRLIKSRHSIVNCSKDFCEAFNSEKSVIEVIDMTKSEADKIHKTLNLDNVFVAAPAVADVSSFHQMQIIDQKVKGFTTSDDGYAYFEKHCK